MDPHSGITPKHRGQAGGHWALVNGEPDHAGRTIHLADAGVDTGDVVYQARIEPDRRNTFATCFYLQAPVGAEGDPRGSVEQGDFLEHGRGGARGGLGIPPEAL
jgi:methionyl-tRNA formyltransferase